MTICPTKRRPVVWIAITTCLIVSGTLDCQDASAQRLFERLRSLRQQRFAPPIRPSAPVTGDPSGRSPAFRQGSDPSGRVLATPMPSSSDQDDNASPPRASFGIDVQPGITQVYPGLKIVRIGSDSLVGQGGLELGDLIVKVGDTRIMTLQDMPRALASAEPGDQIEVQMFRGQQLYRTQVGLIADPSAQPKDEPATDASIAKLDGNPGEPNRGGTQRRAAKPPMKANGPTMAAPRASIGIDVKDAPQQRGVLVLAVPERSAGQAAGLRAGDRLVSADGRVVNTTNDLVREMALREPGQTLVVGIVRQNQLIESEIQLAGPNGMVPRGPSESMDSAVSSKPDETGDGSTDDRFESDGEDPLALPDEASTGAFE